MYKSAATMYFHHTSVYTMYIPCIYHVYTMYIPCIYLIYTCIYNWYSMYILFSGFRGTYRPPALPSDGLEDNVPDVHWMCAILLWGPWRTGNICICVCRWGSASTNILFNYNVYVVYILYIYNVYTMYIQSKIFWYTV